MTLRDAMKRLIDLANPTRFMRFSAAVLPWLAGAAALLLAVGFGLGAVLTAFPMLHNGLKVAGSAYLLYLAVKMWTAPAAARSLEPVATRESRSKLFLAGLAVTMGNPKTMVFYLALLPNLVDLGRVDALAYAELAVVTLSVLALVFGFYIVLALRARALITSPRAVRLVNRGSGVIMAGAAVAIASR